MKKRKGWKWALAGAIWFLMSTVTLLSSPQYDTYMRWPIAAVLCAAFAGLTVWLYSKAKKEEAEYNARMREQIETVQKHKMELDEKIRAFNDRYPQVRFAVAGVTFKNEDKTDRQQILREIVLTQEGKTDVWFEQNEELGDESGISVITDCGCVGNIRRSDKQEFRRFLTNPVTHVDLQAELFTTQEGEKIYRADVVFVLDRESENQKWYFNDLH